MTLLAVVEDDPLGVVSAMPTTSATAMDAPE
jgi:hypothetical protein